MRVEVKLHATLVPFLPPGSRDGAAVVDLAAPATVASLIQALAIPEDLARVVLVDGQDVPDRHELRPGSVVDIFPPLAGGSAPRVVHSGRLWKRLGTRWASRTSNPVSGSRQAGGGFDSHTLPPTMTGRI